MWSIVAVNYSVAQTKSMAEKIEDEEYEMSKPLARFADDEDLEKMLKERLRDGDPMLMFTKKTKSLSTNKKQGNYHFSVYMGETWISTNYIMMSCLCIQE